MKRTYTVLALSLLVIIPVVSAASSMKVVTFSSPNPLTGNPGGFFGDSVAISGNIVVIGAPNEGRAYIFSTTGSLMATLTSPNPQPSTGFGAPVATNGTLVVVGASGETVTGILGAGRAYVFATSGSLIATLTSPDPQTPGSFGDGVAVSGTNIVVGAAYESATGFSQAGHAYIYSNRLSLTTNVTSPNAQTNGLFGAPVAVNGASIVIGGPGEAAGAGHAYIFNTTGSLIATLASPNPQPSGGSFGPPGGCFGCSVGVRGTSVVIGAPNEAAAGFSVAGHAYIYNTNGALISTLVTPNPQNQALFGFSVATDGTNVVVGAPGETVAGFASAGHSYLFSTTSRSVTLASTSPQFGGEFGTSVSAGPSTQNNRVAVMVGQPEAGGGPGHSYLFPALR